MKLVKFIVIIFILFIGFSCSVDNNDPAPGDPWKKSVPVGRIHITNLTVDNKPAINAVAVDSNNNVYIAGSGYNLVNSTSGQDIKICKFNPSGTLLWEKELDGNGGDDAATAIVIDASNNVYIAGYGENIEPGGGSITGKDWWIKQYSPEGTELWELKNDFVGEDDFINSIVIDHKGSIILGGTRTSSGDSDYAIMKFYSNHTQPWTVKTFDNGNDEKLYALAIDSSNDIYAAGTYIFNANTDWWIIKIAATNGTKVSGYADTYGITPSGLPDVPRSMAFNENDVLITTGFGMDSSTSIKTEWIFRRYTTSTSLSPSVTVLFGDSTTEGSGGEDKGYQVCMHADSSFSILGAIETSSNTITTMIKHFTAGATLDSTDTVFSMPVSSTRTYEMTAFGCDNNKNAYVGGVEIVYDASSSSYSFTWITRKI